VTSSTFYDSQYYAQQSIAYQHKYTTTHLYPYYLQIHSTVQICQKHSRPEGGRDWRLQQDTESNYSLLRSWPLTSSPPKLTALCPCPGGPLVPICSKITSSISEISCSSVRPILASCDLDLWPPDPHSCDMDHLCQFVAKLGNSLVK